jgi:hypothetical protein
VSYVNPAKLKGNLDPTLVVVTSTFGFTIAQLKIDCLTQFGGYAKTFRIVNNDTTNVLTYRQEQNSSPLKIVPPSSEVVVNGWESYIEINPNAVTGTGFIEIDIVNKKVAEK